MSLYTSASNTPWPSSRPIHLVSPVPKLHKCKMDRQSYRNKTLIIYNGIIEARPREDTRTPDEKVLHDAEDEISHHICSLIYRHGWDGDINELPYTDLDLITFRLFIKDIVLLHRRISDLGPPGSGAGTQFCESLKKFMENCFTKIGGQLRTMRQFDNQWWSGRAVKDEITQMLEDYDTWEKAKQTWESQNEKEPQTNETQGYHHDTNFEAPPSYSEE